MRCPISGFGYRWKVLAEAAARVEVLAYPDARTACFLDDHDYSEAETRDLFIDLLLREAGWDTMKFKKGQDVEYPVSGLPPDGGDGFVDYVLWGDDGLPLAVVEATRASFDESSGFCPSGFARIDSSTGRGD